MKKLIALILLFPSWAFSYDFFWSGNYSLEGQYFNSVDLGNENKGDKAYLNHHLLLRPEIILFSGLSVEGTLDILNGAGSSLPPSQRVGHILGGDLAYSGPSFAGIEPQALRQRQFSKMREVNLAEAYFKFVHNNGELRVGRQALEFGFGAFYNAGRDALDHWYTNRDGIFYDINFGSLYFTPMVSALTSPVEGVNDFIFEYGLEFHFKVPDSGLDLGAMVLQRRTPAALNTLSALSDSGSSNTTSFSAFYKREKKTYSYGVEAFFQSGDLGRNANGDKIGLRGFGLAGEAELRLASWDFKLKTGYASGNDPNNDANYGGVAFHRNYNLGLILFNHPLGASVYDPTGSFIRGKSGALSAADYQASKVVDTDRIINAIYFAPKVDYSFNADWKLGLQFVSAWLAKNKILAGGNSVSSYLGSEIDLTLNYKITQNINYRATAAYLFTGQAFTANSLYSKKDAFAFYTALSINF